MLEPLLESIEHGALFVGWLGLIAAAIAGALFTGYSATLIWELFFRPQAEAQDAARVHHPPTFSFVLPPLLLTALGTLFPFSLSWFDPLLCTQNVPLAAIPVGPGRCTSTGGVPGSPAQIAAPGRFSANRDDGNLKYDEGDAISSAVKITSELSLNWRSWGAFMRATYFHDFENEGRDDLTEIAQDRIGANEDKSRG